MTERFNTWLTFFRDCYLEIRRLAYEYAERIYFNRDKQLVGKYCFYNFLKRNPSIDIRASQNNQHKWDYRIQQIKIGMII